MKTLLNLLPESRKDAMQKRLRFRFLLWQLFLLFMLEVFYLSILVSTYLVLDYQLKSLNVLGETVPIASQDDEKRLGKYEQKFRDTNGQVEVIGKIERSHLNFSQVFLLLGPMFPPGVTVNHILTNQYRISLTGKAAKRDDLLILDDNLKNARECLQKVDIPISNLFSQKDIDFQADFSVNPDCLKDL